MKRLSVSIVIPAYNEEQQLAECLEAIARQTVKPLEVIVVDNNSTDKTAAVARKYPFVTLLHEKQQGPVYARDRGFNAAKGDIIGRIDADSHIAPDWVATLQQIFKDPGVKAVSGPVSYRYIGLSRAVAYVDNKVRLYMTRHMGPLGEQFLYGSNMGIRRTSWLAVRDKVCRKRSFHEDIDLAAHMAGPDSGVVFRSELHASVDWRQAAAGPKQFKHYVWSSDPVFDEHKLQSRRFERRVARFVSFMYPVVYLLYRGYDHKKKRFSFLHMITGSHTPVRTSPVTKAKGIK